jgi:hypothetical protein
VVGLLRESELGGGVVEEDFYGPEPRNGDQIQTRKGMNRVEYHYRHLKNTMGHVYVLLVRIYSTGLISLKAAVSPKTPKQGDSICSKYLKNVRRSFMSVWSHWHEATIILEQIRHQKAWLVCH